MCLEPEMTTNEESEFLQEIGERNLRVIRQIAAGMHLGNVEVAITYDNRIDNTIAALQERTCDLGLRIDNWYDRLNQADDNNRASIAYTMRRVVENERKQAEVESAVAILQRTSKEHQEAIAQLIAYTNKVHGKQANLNHNITITRIDLKAMEKKFITLAWINLGIWVAVALTLFFLLLIVS